MEHGWPEALLHHQISSLLVFIFWISGSSRSERLESGTTHESRGESLGTPCITSLRRHPRSRTLHKECIEIQSSQDQRVPCVLSFSSRETPAMSVRSGKSSSKGASKSAHANRMWKHRPVIAPRVRGKQHRIATLWARIGEPLSRNKHG